MQHFTHADTHIKPHELQKLYEYAINLTDFKHANTIVSELRHLDIPLYWVFATLLVVGRVEGIRAERKRRSHRASD